MNRGLTLLETLAATSLLGLVVATIIPLTVRLGMGERGIEERLQARYWLSNRDDPATGGVDLVQPIKGHAGWYLHRRAFLRTSTKPAHDVLAPPDHSWVQLTVRNGSERTAEVLADRVMLVLDHPAATNQSAP